jgi:hypothetical protein
VATGDFTEADLCEASFTRDYAAACKTILPLVEFTIRARELEFSREAAVEIPGDQFFVAFGSL